jgi:subtilisin family serine protease
VSARRHGRAGRWLTAAGAAAVLVGASLTAGGTAASAHAAPLNIEPELVAELASGGQTTFWVYLDERADLSRAPRITAEPTSRVAATRWVFQELTRTAEVSQARLRALLDARGVDYTPYWISNVIRVVGDRALAEELAAHPDVSHLEVDSTYHIVEPTERVDSSGDNGVTAVEWGVANINADDVWAQFGVTGEGIVVANIDTGVRYTHAALVDKYRGNLGGGVFDHNYNWFDPANICPGDAPCDNNNHGTHTMGTMVGDDGGTNQIGVAPGARWIAAKGCETNSCSTASLLASGQWVVAPTDLNGNNPDPAMAPHIVNNSWGGGRGDRWYEDTINAWVAAGIFPMFSAGNSGPACNTANSPGDNIPAYAVGAYDINNNIASFSSRGFSGVDGTTIKPNISAPGVAVRSATAASNTSYGSFSGTSMASPHASGVVALVWSAAPDLIGDVAATRALLDATARDTSNLTCGGTPDNNNVFGEGRIDALAAVEAAVGGEPPQLPPVADFSFSCDDATLTCTFDASASFDPDGTVVAWDWNFGDGTTGSGEVVTHTYAAGGSFTVTLTVTDDSGATDTDTQRVTVGPNQPPVADFSAACNGLIFIFWCTFDGGASVDPDGMVVSWSWDFGDGTTGSGQTVLHFYGAPGAYDVTLTVTDDAGLTDSVTKRVNVPILG